MPNVSAKEFRLLATVSPRREVEAVRRAPRVKKFIQHRTAVEGDVLTLDIPLETHNYKSAGRNRWVGGRETARQREVVNKELLRVRAIMPPLPVHVLLTRFGPKELDPGDNITASLSAVRDELAAFYEVSDKDPKIIKFDYKQTAGSPYGISIEIREAKHVGD